MVKRLEKLTPYQWIKDETLEIDWDKGIYVSHLLPQRYSHYCKIFNPLFRDKNFTDENVFYFECDPDVDKVESGEKITLKAVVDKYQIPYTKEINSRAIKKKLGGYPRYLIYGNEGKLDTDELKEVVSELRAFTNDQECYFYYEVLKTIYAQPEDIGEHLYSGRLNDVLPLSRIGEMGGLGSPTSWWPEDKSWCVFTGYDLEYSLVGGSKNLITALLSNPNLECLEVDLDTRIDV
ncbi:hypothetical protein FIU87_04265 [Bacillus sp. THAF10]|uniref:hypothetical protein n=1 Tax=Bacillus sp. THAF10 TaxID=2587848 RepID=UPI0012687378|nr:hypothetical protein [Bacillus sp. THAF10]QFT87861.1 hypothetical protein FIU87_04265 [Bacillus sp. THAF10]